MAELQTITDLQALALRALPYTYMQIAAACNMHPKTVARIIKRKQSTTTQTVAKLFAAIDKLDAEKVK